MKRSLAPLLYLIASGLTFGAVGLWVFSFAYRRGESFAEGSSFRATQDGLRALALLLESQKFRVSRLQEPWALKDRRGVLITLGIVPKIENGRSAPIPTGRLDPEEVKSWAARGNRVVLLAPVENHFLEAWGLSLVPLETSSSVARGAGQVRSITVRSNRGIQTPGHAEVLAAVEGRPVAIRLAHGDGDLIVVSDAHGASNIGLPEADNALFYLGLAWPAKDEEIIFDETGSRLLFGEPGVITYARKAGVHWLFLEALLIGVFGLWFLGSRMGPPLARRPPEPRAAADFVTGLAMLYERAYQGRAIYRILLDSLRDDVRQCYGLRGPFSTERAEQAMADDETAQARFRELMARGSALSRRSSITPSELISFSRDVFDFRNDVLWKPKSASPRPTKPSAANLAR